MEIRKLNFSIIVVLLIIVINPHLSFLFAQEDEEPILYYHMEPLNDSLFLKIQEGKYK